MRDSIEKQRDYYTAKGVHAHTRTHKLQNDDRAFSVTFIFRQIVFEVGERMELLRKPVSGVMLTLLLTGMLALSSNIQPVKASGTIYIRADGSIDPPTAPISTVDNITYTFTSNIYDSIVIERNNIVLNGAGYILEGTKDTLSKGIYLSLRSNVTIKNMEIKAFLYGIELYYSSNIVISGNDILANSDWDVALFHSSNNIISRNNIGGIGLWGCSSNIILSNNITRRVFVVRSGVFLLSSSNNIISGNNVTAYDEGVLLSSSSDNTISNNSIAANNVGIDLSSSSSNNIISGNNITENNWRGIELFDGSNNDVSGNNVAENGWALYATYPQYVGGLYLYSSYDNRIYHNNFIDNAVQVHISVSRYSIWDDGYPSGGNYWSDYTDVDLYSGPYQNETGSDGIWDHPYVIDANNKDRYPLVNPWTEARAPTEWNKTYGGISWDEAWALVQTSDGGYALAGETSSFGAGGYDFWLVKTDASGNMEWNKTYGGTNNDWAYALVQTVDGGYALAGQTLSFGAGSWDCWLVKTDASGSMQWNKTYGGTSTDEAYALVQTSDGGYALAGLTYSFGAGDRDFWLVKTDASGNALWNRTYGGISNDEVRALLQTGDGGYALAGETSSFGAGSNDFWLVKTDASGAMQWEKTYGGTGNDWGPALVQTSDGGYALGGTTSSFGVSNYDFWLVKLGLTPQSPDFSTTASPNSLTIQQGGSSTSTITVTSINGFNNLVELTRSGMPSGVTASFDLQFVVPPAGGSETSTLTVTVDGTAPLGSYTLTVTGTSGALTHSVYISLEIKAMPQILCSQYWQSGLELSVGGMIAESTVKFAGVVSSPNGGLVKLEVELRQLTEYNGQFDETKGGLKESPLVDSGSLATIQVYDLIRGQYHWRARTADEHGTFSEWQDFGNNNIKEPDFTVCNKFKIVYPEGWMNLKLFVPVAYCPVGYLDKIKFDLQNRRDMWYKITVSSRMPGESWHDITDQIWEIPYIGPYSGATQSLLYSPADGEEIRIELKDDWSDGKLLGLKILDAVVCRGLVGVCVPPKIMLDSWTQTKGYLEELGNSLKDIGIYLQDNPVGSLAAFKMLVIYTCKITVQYSGILTSILADLGVSTTISGKVLNVMRGIVDEVFDLYKLVQYYIISKDLLANMCSYPPQKESVILRAEEKLTSIAAPNVVLTEGLDLAHEGTCYQGDKINANFMIKNVGLLPISLHAVTVGGRTEEGYVQDFSFKTDVTIDPGETFSYEGELTLLHDGRNYFFAALQLEDGEWITDVPTEAGHVNNLYLDVESPSIVLNENLCSPGELHISDNHGRVTGLIAGETKCEIPHSFYYEGTIIVFSPDNDLRHCVIGTGEGTYGLEIAYVDHGETTLFTAIDIPTSANTVHEYSIDWNALLSGEKGVTVQIDSDGDGVFEHTFTSDSELTQSEYVAAVHVINTWITDSDFNKIESFRAVFTPSSKTGLYNLTATNPGQFYFNILVNNTWPEPLNITVVYSIDANFILKGARPIHVYADLDRTIDITSTCTFLDNKIIAYNVPPNGIVYVTIHLDYALKGTIWTKSQVKAWYSQHTFNATAETDISSIKFSVTITDPETIIPAISTYLVFLMVILPSIMMSIGLLMLLKYASSTKRRRKEK
jgi:parallel beta-helix repeat protein